MRTKARTGEGPGPRRIVGSARPSLVDGSGSAAAAASVPRRSGTVTAGSPGNPGPRRVVDREPLVPMARPARVKTPRCDSAPFSLIGFTRAYGALAGCR